MIGWGRLAGPSMPTRWPQRQRESAIRLALQEIADAQGDVDAFIAQQSESGQDCAQGCGGDRPAPSRGGPLPRRPGTRSTPSMKARPGWIPFDWEEVRLEVMEAPGPQG